MGEAKTRRTALAAGLPDPKAPPKPPPHIARYLKDTSDFIEACISRGQKPVEMTGLLFDVTTWELLRRTPAGVELQVCQEVSQIFVVSLGAQAQKLIYQRKRAGVGPSLLGPDGSPLKGHA